MPGAHARPAAHRGRVRRLVVLALLALAVAVVSPRATVGRVTTEGVAADRVATAGSSGAAMPSEAGAPGAGSAGVPSDRSPDRAAPDLGTERLDEVHRQWFLLPGAVPNGALPPVGAIAGTPPVGPTTSLPTAAPAPGTTAPPGGGPPLPPEPPKDQGPPARSGPGEAEGRQVPPAFDDLRPGLPERAVVAYRSAEAALRRALPGCHLDWHLLAAIGTVESDNGRFGGAGIGADGRVSPPIIGIVLDGSRSGTAVVQDTDNGRLDGDAGYDRAVGPMQFLPGTWAAFGRSASPGRAPDPQNIDNAALSAGWYLCAGGRDLADPAGRRAAVLAYNPSNTYADTVIALARALAGDPAPVATATSSAPRPVASPTRSTPAVTPTSSPSTPPTSSPTPTPTSRPTSSPTVTPTSTPSSSSPTTTPTAIPSATPTPTTTEPTSTEPTTTEPSETEPATTEPTTTEPTVPLVLVEDPEDPGRVTVTWQPRGDDVTLRLERQDEDGDWQAAGDPDHRHAPAGEEPVATWEDLPSGRYRVTLVPDDSAGGPLTSEEVDVAGCAPTDAR